MVRASRSTNETELNFSVSWCATTTSTSGGTSAAGRIIIELAELGQPVRLGADAQRFVASARYTRGTGGLSAGYVATWDPLRDPLDAEFGEKCIPNVAPSITSSEENGAYFTQCLFFRLLPKLDVVGSSPIARSLEIAKVQVVPVAGIRTGPGDVDRRRATRGEDPSPNVYRGRARGARFARSPRDLTTAWSVDSNCRVTRLVAGAGTCYGILFPESMARLTAPPGHRPTARFIGIARALW